MLGPLDFPPPPPGELWQKFRAWTVLRELTSSMADTAESLAVLTDKFTRYEVLLRGYLTQAEEQDLDDFAKALAGVATPLRKLTEDLNNLAERGLM